MPSLGEEYRQILSQKQAQAPIKPKKPDARVTELNKWFGKVASEFPKVAKQALQSLKDGTEPPRMEWEFPHDFIPYDTIDLKHLEGYESLLKASETLDMGFHHHVEEGRNMVDDRTKTLTVKAYPDSPGHKTFFQASYDMSH